MKITALPLEQGIIVHHFVHEYLADTDYVGVVRASLGRYTTKDDVDRLIMAVEEIGEE